ncbi:BrnT family toxin [Bdellovibrio sp. HCB2-146]|uniref:BrnT family toxin n=1 Tax=Bdellovibrio sp. HCB2-146 TaxID=3394362 RepID=UPI0039BCCE37
MKFEWDEHKADINFKKHNVHFFEATSLWNDENSLEILDPDSPDDEDRWVRMGMSGAGNILVVVYAERILRIRIISARKASKKEEQYYYGSKR